MPLSTEVAIFWKALGADVSTSGMYCQYLLVRNDLTPLPISTLLVSLMCLTATVHTFGLTELTEKINVSDSPVLHYRATYSSVPRYADG